ncbi:hypothetical protein [Pediococcus pentosaceus]|uniref:hypothetical protein n=1 Tax=Pediococcus pentosaceus TaxID=1255 RepID=UPI001F4240E8|nr:hypothetical protein [Pediococcus pentosaceus]
MQKPKIVIDNLPEESFFEIYKDEDRMLINHQLEIKMLKSNSLNGASSNNLTLDTLSLIKAIFIG